VEVKKKMEGRGMTKMVAMVMGKVNPPNEVSSVTYRLEVVQMGQLSEFPPILI
jgi:hypothetical protein